MQSNQQDTRLSTTRIYAALRESDFYRQLLSDEEGCPLLTEAELSHLASTVQPLSLGKRQTIFQQGDPGETAYIIVTGTVKGRVEYADISQAKEFEMGPGDLFGEISLLTGLSRTATTYTEQEVELLELSESTFAHLLALREGIPEILANLVAKRQQDDLETLHKLRKFEGKNIAQTLGRQKVLGRFLGLLLDNNFMPTVFPQIFKAEGSTRQQTILDQLQESEFCTKLLVDEEGHPLLTVEELSTLTSRVKPVHFHKGETIFHQGEAGQTAYIILSGKVKGRVEYKETSQGKEFEMGRGTLFGEISLITGLSRTATTYTEQHVELLELSRQTFAHLLALRPEIPEVLADLVVQRQEGDEAMLHRLKHFADRDVGKTLDRDNIMARFGRMGIEVFGFYARAPYAVLNHLSTAASDQLVTSTLASLYLTDNFAPVHRERTVENLTVIGELPAALSGMFLRVGPNPQFPPVGRYHWFDGDGMIHGVQLNNGKAEYRNRYIRTKGFTIEQAAGKAIWPGLLNLPRFDHPYGILFKNAANTALVWHGGKLLALWEAGEPYVIELPSLETIGPHTFNGKLTGPSFTAHPKIDPVTGEMMFFGYSPISPPYLQYGIVSAAGELLRIVPIDLPYPVIMHDFAITEHYTIFMDMPLNLQPSRLLRGEVPVVFSSERRSRFGILPRHGDNSNIRWFEVPTCMVYHTVNAYEEGDEVVLIAYRMSSTNLLIPEYSSDGFVKSQAEKVILYCWRFNLATGAVREQVLDRVLAEFPRIDEGLVGRRMRYVYAGLGAPYMAPKPLFDGVIKYDFSGGVSAQTYYFGRGRFGGECVFAPRPGATVEDDGWVLTYVHDAIAQRSEFLVMDARDITAGPVARVLLPQRVPYGFHAAWISDEQMARTGV